MGGAKVDRADQGHGTGIGYGGAMEKMTATPAERKAAERARKKAAGLVKLDVWTKPEHIAAIKAFVATLSQTLDETATRQA
jgi:hypothetical protein